MIAEKNIARGEQRRQRVGRLRGRRSGELRVDQPVFKSSLGLPIAAPRDHAGAGGHALRRAGRRSPIPARTARRTREPNLIRPMRSPVATWSPACG